MRMWMLMLVSLRLLAVLVDSPSLLMLQLMMRHTPRPFALGFVRV